MCFNFFPTTFFRGQTDQLGISDVIRICVILKLICGVYLPDTFIHDNKLAETRGTPGLQVQRVEKEHNWFDKKDSYIW